MSRKAIQALRDEWDHAVPVAGGPGPYASWLEHEVVRLRGLARDVLDALDAEKTPDYGVGHDKAWLAALAMLNKQPIPLEGKSVPLGDLRDNA